MDAWTFGCSSFRLCFSLIPSASSQVSGSLCFLPEAISGLWPGCGLPFTPRATANIASHTKTLRDPVARHSSNMRFLPPRLSIKALGWWAQAMEGGSALSQRTSKEGDMK